MSVNLPLRALGPRSLSRRAKVITSGVRLNQHRTAADDATKKPASNPVLEEYYRKQAKENSQPPPNPTDLHKPGDLAPSSIFEDERRQRVLQERRKSDHGDHFLSSGDQVSIEPSKPEGYKRDPELMARVLDPDPAARERWERKKVIQSIRKGGRMTRTEMLARQEREHLARSPNLKTSVKKLGMLARQIAGKTIEEAEIQMRFSKKKAAREILQHLEAAKNEAIVAKGMGLGYDGNGNTLRQRPQDIQLKDGKRYKVSDLSKMYIDQAWVGRGPFGKLAEFRARGRVNLLRTPWTSISLLLKEEKTRVREWQDREKKRQRQRKENLWVHHTDRPLLGPRGQYFSW